MGVLRRAVAPIAKLARAAPQGSPKATPRARSGCGKRTSLLFATLVLLALTSVPTGAQPAALQVRPAPATQFRAASVSQTRGAWKKEELQRRSDGTLRWWSGQLGELPAGKSGAEAASAFLDMHPNELGLGAISRFLEPLKEHQDQQGGVHTRLRQHVVGIPVWGRQLVLHADPAGRVVAVNGHVSPVPTSPDLSRSLSESDAVRTAIEAVLHLEQAASTRLDVSDVFFDAEQHGLRLSYLVTLTGEGYQKWSVIVDARSGEVHHTEQLHKSWNEGDSDRERGSFVDAVGVDLTGTLRSMRVYQDDAGQYGMIWDLPNVPVSFTPPNGPSTGGSVTWQEDGSGGLSYVQSGSNTWNDPAAVSAHVNAQIAYRYFRDNFGRRAIDDRDGTLISVVHASVPNAAWLDPYMLYSDGDANFSNFAEALDVAGHEMTHGVIEHSAGLIYQFQSGALNESFADVFGALIENDDYLMGEDVVRSGPVALRDLWNPANPDVIRPQPAHMSQYRDLPASEDHGGVHVNSGIPNRAAAIVISQLGTEKAGQLYYQALTSYLTPTSQFADARQALERSAVDLFGAESAELGVVRAAFDEVGIFLNSGSAEELGAANNIAPATGVGRIALVLSGDGLGLFDPDSAVLQELLPPGSIHPSSQLAIPRSGERIYYIGQDGLARSYSLSDHTVTTYGSFAFTSGDLRNIAVSPDESLFFFRSAYNPDGAWYVSLGEAQLLRVPVKVQTSQEGVFDQSLIQLDVMSFGPNAAFQTFAFDAVRPPYLGSTGQLWSAYLAPLEQLGNALTLVPQQGDGLDVGNITFSSTDPDIIAFNVRARGSEAIATVLTDLVFGLSVVLNEPHAERPTFSPDDLHVAFTTSGGAELVLLDFTTGGRTAVSFGEPVSNPVWFSSIIGTGTAAEEAPPERASVRVSPIYPNPSSGEAQVEYHTAPGESVLIELIDILGRVVRSTYSTSRSGGMKTESLSARDLPVGVYVLRISARSGVTTQTFVRTR